MLLFAAFQKAHICNSSDRHLRHHTSHKTIPEALLPVSLHHPRDLPHTAHLQKTSLFQKQYLQTSLVRNNYIHELPSLVLQIQESISPKLPQIPVFLCFLPVQKYLCHLLFLLSFSRRFLQPSNKPPETIQ